MSDRDLQDAPGQDGPQPRPAEADPERPPLVEWLVGAIGLALLLATLGYLGWRALEGNPQPPAPVVEVLAVEPQAGRFLVRFRVRNAGTETAERLEVAGQLRQGDEVLEESRTEFEFLPGRSAREGGLFFTRDPTGLELTLESKSYQKP